MSDRVRLWLLASIVGLLAACLAVLGLVSIYVADSVKPAQQSRDLLVECVTPPNLREPPVKHPKPGDCWVRSNAQQGDIIGEPKGPINTVAVAAAACGAANPGDVEATLRCTRAAIKP